MITQFWTRVLPVVAAGACVAGIVTILVGSSEPRTFGWFAYAPMSDQVFAPEGANFVPTSSLVGGLVLATGCVGLAFWAGLTLGSRRAPFLS